MEALEFGTHLHAELGVEVRWRLVHEEDVRATDQRAAERHPLLLVARRLPSGEEMLDAEECGGRADLAVDLGLLRPAHPEGKCQSVVDRLLRGGRVVPENRRDVAVLGVEVVDEAIADPDLAVSELEKAGHEVERRGLAASRRPDERHDRPRR